MPLAIKINPKDNVVVALHPIAKAPLCRWTVHL